MSTGMQKLCCRMVPALLLLAVPCYVVCGLSHVCMAGHMQHGPYPFLHRLNDGIWVPAFAVAMFLCWAAQVWARRTIVFACLFLALSRLLAGSGGGLFFLAETPFLILLAALAVGGLFFGVRDPGQVPAEGRRRKVEILKWVLALGAPFAALAAVAWIFRWGIHHGLLEACQPFWDLCQWAQQGMHGE